MGVKINSADFDLEDFVSRIEKSDVFINVSVAPVYAEPRYASEMVTQALLGERIEILEENPRWYRIHQWDGYEGWLHRSFAATAKDDFLNRIESGKVMIVGDLFGSVCERPDNESPVVRDLVYGNRVVIIDTEENWKRVLLPDGVKGWTDSEPQRGLTENPRTSLVQEAYRFLGIQYLWGGKSTKGFDCSGFVQTVMKPLVDLPRDTRLQVDNSVLDDTGLKEIEKGDLIFFGENGKEVDHVAISLGGDEFIHCSGFVRIGRIDVDSRRPVDDLGKEIVAVRSIKRHCGE